MVKARQNGRITNVPLPWRVEMKHFFHDRVPQRDDSLTAILPES
jgi:hypothetical protein